MTAPDLESLRWHDVDVALNATMNMQALNLYRDEVVRPALATLDGRHAEARAKDDPGTVFWECMLEDTHALSVEGFLLTVQSLFERGLRRMMVAAAHQRGGDVKRIRKALWRSEQTVDVQQLFEGLFGAPLSLFGPHQDLELLQVLGNALRHGDGASAERLHKLVPSLWHHWLPPGTVIPGVGFQVPETAPRHPSFDNITLPVAFLEQMIQSVLWFWEDVEFVRCNSFSSTHSSTVRFLDELREKRSQRASLRVWSQT